MEITYDMLPGNRYIAPRIIPDEEGPTQWEFICPLCLQKWNSLFYKEHLLQSCPTCKAKEPPPENRYSQEPWINHFFGALP